MRIKAAMVGAIAVAFVGGWLIAGNSVSVQGQAQPNAGFAAVPGEKGGLDITGPHEVVADWPKPLANLPGHQNWTWGSVQGVFAESPNRVYMVQRGELPAMQRPRRARLPTSDRACRFLSVRRRSATRPRVRPRARRGRRARPGSRRPEAGVAGRMGVDARWEHTIVVFNAAGDLVEGWTQGQDDEASALGIRQPVRRTEERVDRRRPQPRHLQVHQRRQTAPANDRHPGQGRIGRRPFQPPHVHVVAARWQLLRGRRIQRQPRGEVRQGRQVPVDVGRTGAPGWQGNPTRLLQHRARHRGRSDDAARTSAIARIGESRCSTATAARSSISGRSGRRPTCSS